MKKGFTNININKRTNKILNIMKNVLYSLSITEHIMERTRAKKDRETFEKNLRVGVLEAYNTIVPTRYDKGYTKTRKGIRTLKPIIYLPIRRTKSPKADFWGAWSL